MKAMVKRIRSSVVLTVAVIVLLTTVVGGSLALLEHKTGAITNLFGVPKTDITIVEEIPDDQAVKESVAVKNSGNIDVFVRVAVVVTWKNDSGVAPKMPVEGTDYTCDWILGTDWLKGNDGFYYYAKALQVGATTSNLLQNVKLKDDAEVPDGYNLSVEVISQAIQSEPHTAVTDAWGVSVDSNGKIVVSDQIEAE